MAERDEAAFRRWYAEQVRRTAVPGFSLDPDPDAPEHKYDYRAAFKAGAKPKLDKSDGRYHWPSEFKADDHPRRFLPLGKDGAIVDTKREKTMPKPKKTDKRTALEQEAVRSNLRDMQAADRPFFEQFTPAQLQGLDNLLRERGNWEATTESGRVVNTGQRSPLADPRFVPPPRDVSDATLRTALQHERGRAIRAAGRTDLPQEQRDQLAATHLALTEGVQQAHVDKLRRKVEGTEAPPRDRGPEQLYDPRTKRMRDADPRFERGTQVIPAFEAPRQARDTPGTPEHEARLWSPYLAGRQDAPLEDDDEDEDEDEGSALAKFGRML